MRSLCVSEREFMHQPTMLSPPAIGWGHHPSIIGLVKIMLVNEGDVRRPLLFVMQQSREKHPYMCYCVFPVCFRSVRSFWVKSWRHSASAPIMLCRSKQCHGDGMTFGFKWFQHIFGLTLSFLHKLLGNTRDLLICLQTAIQRSLW